MADVRALFCWALVIMFTASYSRNPLYSFILLLTTLWVYSSCTLTEEKNRVPVVPLRFTLFAVPLAAIFNALLTHVGETTLFHLPTWIPLLGGEITLEALIYGAINGLNLAVIFTGFTAFNRAVAVRDLIKLTPRAFHESGVVLSIALTFVPQTMLDFDRIREAQMVRGHRVHGLRDWIPIFSPLMVSSLERALALAETMVARGYATVAAVQTHTRLLLTMGLLAALGGGLAFILMPGNRGVSVAVLLMGIFLFMLTLWQMGRKVRYTVYRQQHWRLRDTLIILGLIPSLLVLLLQQASLSYTPYPALTWPGFAPIIGFSLLGLLMPVFFADSERKK